MNINSRTYSESLALDDTIARKVNTSDASEFARICVCCPLPSRGNKVPFSSYNCCPISDPFFLVWGLIWLLPAFGFFALGIIVGLLAFKASRPPVLLFVEHKLTFRLFISKMLNNKQAMHLNSFLFQDLVVHFL